MKLSNIELAKNIRQWTNKNIKNIYEELKIIRTNELEEITEKEINKYINHFISK